MILRIDTDEAAVVIEDGDRTRRIPFTDPEAFSLVSKAWLRIGWDVKYVYRFTWFGRPIIQLPDDIVRLQEVVYRLKPDVIVETGIAHGGSLMLFASLCQALDRGRVVGIDADIRPHNRAAIESHPLFPRVTLIEGDSIDPSTVRKVQEAVGDVERVLVVLDSNHTKRHVLEELRLYSPLVSIGSYVLAEDGIMRDVAGGPRTTPAWTWDNPLSAIEQFLAENKCFVREEPAMLFDESAVDTAVTYSPGGWLRRLK